MDHSCSSYLQIISRYPLRGTDENAGSQGSRGSPGPQPTARSLRSEEERTASQSGLLSQCYCLSGADSYRSKKDIGKYPTRRLKITTTVISCYCQKGASRYDNRILTITFFSPEKISYIPQNFSLGEFIRRGRSVFCE